jgi:hypothetical protein
MPVSTPQAPEPVVPDDVPSSDTAPLPQDVPSPAQPASIVTASPEPVGTTAVRRLRSHPRAAAACLGVFVLALAVRLGVVLTSSGGLTGLFISYDTSVYYAASDAITFGRMPYRDFTLLHPPGLPLMLTPFAMLGRLTNDHLGFMAAAVGFTVLGAVNAMLVTVVARRMGVGLPGAVLGGAFYAVWLGSVRAEFMVRLEPLGNFFVLVGLLAYLSAERSGRRRGLLWAGAAFGAAVSVKIWWAVPLLVLIAWQLARTRRRRLVPVSAGAALALAVVNGPFLLAAPGAMWHMVVIDQLARPRDPASLGRKGRYLTGVSYLLPDGPRLLVAILVLAGAVAIILAMVAAWRRQAARLVVGLLAVQLAVLALAPSWFTFYADYLTPVAALTIAAAVVPLRWPAHWPHTVPEQRRIVKEVAGWIVTVTTVAVVTVSGVATARLLAAGNNYIVPFPTAPLTAAVSGVHCLMSDTPTDLILLNTLSRDLRNGCPNWVDVTGRTHGVDKVTHANGREVARQKNRTFQRNLRRYLTSGDAVILGPGWRARVSALTLSVLRSGGVLADIDGQVVYRTPR